MLTYTIPTTARAAAASSGTLVAMRSRENFSLVVEKWTGVRLAWASAAERTKILINTTFQQYPHDPAIIVFKIKAASM